MIVIHLARRLRLGELIRDFSKDLQVLSSGIGLMPSTKAQVLSTSTTLLASWHFPQSTRQRTWPKGPQTRGSSGDRHLAMSGDISGVTTVWGMLLASRGQVCYQTSMFKKAPTTKNYLIQNVYSAKKRNPEEDRRPWSEVLS